MIPLLFVYDRSMKDRDKVSNRLKSALDRRRMSQTELSQKTGISKSLISSYVSGRYEPNVDTIGQMAQILRVSAAWLAGFDVPMEEDMLPVSQMESGTISVPFISQRLSCGPGETFFSDEDMEVTKIEILPQIAKGYDKSSLIAARVKGDSMINISLNPNDIVFFSRGTVENEGIYAIALRGEVFVKRLQFNPIENTVLIISENDKYTNFKVEADDENFVILGKVVGWIHNENY